MTSHLTTHRKPKPDKSFRAHFSSEIEEYDNNEAGIISGEYTTKPNVKNFRAFEQSKQLNSQNIGSNHYVLGDMQNIEVHTAAENSDQQNVNLEHGLGLLSSVARKGDTTDVQVDGIVNIPESQFSGTSSSNNVDQVVEVLIRNSAEDKSNQGSTLSVQMPAGNSQNKIILDPSTQAVTDADGQEIPLDSNTANNLANILQNPDVLAAINNAASTNKLIVIGPVSMFDGSTSQSSSVTALSTAENSIDGNVSATFSQEQLAQISAMVQQEQSTTQVSSQSVNDSISATSALAAVESYLQSEQPSSSISVKGDEVVGNILGSIQPDGKRGPSAVVQSAQAQARAANNLTISMPPMTQSSLSITQVSMGMDVSNKLPIMKSLELQSTSSEEVTSSNDVHRDSQGEPDGQISEAGQSNIDEQQLVIHQEQAESTTHPPEEFMIANNDLGHPQYIATDQNVVADSSDMVDAEASSSGEPVLLLSTDENGQPQIIVKMPDGSETIMSDPALAESLIQVPTITNAGIEGNEAEAAAMVEQLPNTIQLQMPDQGVPDSEEPTQSGMAQSQFASQSHQISSEVVQLPDQGLSSESTVEADGGNVDSSCSVHLESNQTTQQSVVSNSTSIVVQTPDSSSSQNVSEGQIDSRQGLFVMEHVSASDEQSGYPEQSHIDFPPQSSEFQADSSSSGTATGEEPLAASEEVVDGNVVVESTYLQMNDVSQSTNVSNLDIVTTAEPGTVSSTDDSQE